MKRLAKVPLGGLSVDEFLDQHWQRRPLLVRAALPADCSPMSVDAVLALASDDAVESRLVSRAQGRWRLSHGPFDADALPPRDRRGWTVLVQGVDLHSEEAAHLRDRFAFLPHARIDDLMISYASDGGGVGPHVDSYDVFLLQVHGRRRWKVSQQADLTMLPGLPLKILAHFRPQEEWLLEPGDLLYLPPGWAHDGVAEGECMTCSIGFRAPSRLELLRAFLADAADRVDGADPRFGDAGRPPARHPGALPEDLRAFAHGAVRSFVPTAPQIDEFLGRFLTEPKPTVFFDPPVRPLASVPLQDSVLAARLATMALPPRAVPDTVDSPVAPVRQPITVRSVRHIRKLERPWFRRTFADVEWAFLGSNYVTALDTTRSWRLRAALEADYGSPTQTIVEVSQDTVLTLATAIEFEYWFVVNDTIPVVVSDVSGPLDRGLIIATDRHLRDRLTELRDVVFGSLVRNTSLATFADYYFDVEGKAWYLVGYDGHRFVMRATPRPPLRTRPLSSTLRR